MTDGDTTTMLVERRAIKVRLAEIDTLVFSRAVVRKWGFHTSNGWVPRREYDPT